MSLYETQARRMQLALTQAFQRPAPYEFDSIFDLQRMAYPLSIADPAWKAFEQQRLLANDIAVFMMEILMNLWTHAGFDVAVLDQTVPSQHALYLRCGLQVHSDVSVSNMPSPSGSRDELRYSQFVGLDVFRLLYETPNPLPILNDYQLQVLTGDFDFLPLYLYGVVLLNHPWTLTERARVNLKDTPYPWRTAAEALADSHLRYHFPEDLTTDATEALGNLFRRCVFPPSGYQGDRHGEAVAKSVLEMYFNSGEAQRQLLRNAFARLVQSPNTRLQTLGQALHFMLCSEQDRQEFRQQLFNGNVTLARDFDSLVKELVPLLQKKRMPAPKPEDLDLLPGTPR